MPQCPYCHKPCKSERGLRQHINQTPRCLLEERRRLGIAVGLGGSGSLSSAIGRKQAPTRTEILARDLRIGISGGIQQSPKRTVCNPGGGLQESRPEPPDSVQPPKKKRKRSPRKNKPQAAPKPPPPARETATLAQIMQQEHGTRTDAQVFLSAFV